MSKIAFLGDDVTVPALFGQILERDGLEAVVCVVRVDDRWEACWSSGVNNGSLSMAALKLLSVVEDNMHGVGSTWSPPEGTAA